MNLTPLSSYIFPPRNIQMGHQIALAFAFFIRQNSFRNESSLSQHILVSGDIHSAILVLPPTQQNSSLGGVDRCLLQDGEAIFVQFL
jgi:hypothetical protein